MTTRSEPNLPDTLPATACVERDLFRDYVGDGREYRGHNGDCDNCGATFRESDDSDLATAHWSHRRAVARAIWDRDEPADIRELALAMDPDDPMDATDHARAILASGWIDCANAKALRDTADAMDIYAKPGHLSWSDWLRARANRIGRSS